MGHLRTCTYAGRRKHLSRRDVGGVSGARYCATDIGRIITQGVTGLKWSCRRSRGTGLTRNFLAEGAA